MKKRAKEATQPSRRLVASFKRAKCEIYEVAPFDVPLADRRIEVKIDPHPLILKRGVINAEKWDYDTTIYGLIAMVGHAYKAGVDVASPEFERTIIKAHEAVARECLL